MITVSQLKSNLTQKLHGQTLKRITDIYSTLQATAEMVQSRIDLNEAMRTATIANAVYDSVYDYQCPSDIKSDSIIDIRPQANRGTDDSISTKYVKSFDIKKAFDTANIKWRNGTPFLRLSKSLSAPVSLEQFQSTTGFTATNNFTAPTLDTLNYVSGNSSLKTTSTVNAGTLASINIRIGSSAVNYYSMTATSGHFEPFKVGWNLIRFDFSSATAVGTPVSTGITYLEMNVVATQTGTITKSTIPSTNLSTYITDGALFIYVYIDSLTALNVVRFDSLTANLGTIFEMDYYSSFLFIDGSTGAWKEKPTSDSDFLVCSTVSLPIFENELGRIVTQHAQGSSGGFDFAYYNSVLEDSKAKLGLYTLYAQKYPSQRILPSTDYYNFEESMLDSYNDLAD